MSLPLKEDGTIDYVEATRLAKLNPPTRSPQEMISDLRALNAAESARILAMGADGPRLIAAEREQSATNYRRSQRLKENCVRKRNQNGWQMLSQPAQQSRRATRRLFWTHKRRLAENTTTPLLRYRRRPLPLLLKKICRTLGTSQNFEWNKNNGETRPKRKACDPVYLQRNSNGKF